jgi:hypothetical protein
VGGERGAGEGGGKSLLNGLDGAFGVRFLVTAGRQAEERREDVVAGQRRVSRLESAFSPEEDQRGDSPRVVPPNFLGHRPEKLEGRDHPFENRLGAFKGESQDERSVGVRPGRDQKRHEPAALGEIDVDVPEIGFETLPRWMGQRDERFLMPTSVLPQIALDLRVPTTVGVFVAKPPEELGGRMPLLGWCRLVIDQDLIDDRLNRPQ